MHVVILDFVHFHGAEGADAHVECHIGQLHAFGCGRAEELFGEVEACRGRGHGTLYLRVDGLVTVFVFGVVFAGDVWWKRHLADLFESFEEDAFVLELYDPGAVVGVVYDGGAEEFVVGIVGFGAVGGGA